MPFVLLLSKDYYSRSGEAIAFADAKCFVCKFAAGSQQSLVQYRNERELQREPKFLISAEAERLLQCVAASRSDL